MIKHLLSLDGNREVVAEWPNIEPGNDIRQSNFDATGRTVDSPPYLGRTYDPVADTFSAPPVVPASARQALADKTPWTAADRDLALRILLDERKGI